MTPAAYLYICDGDIDHPVLTHKKMDWPEKYPHWQEIPLVMARPAQQEPVAYIRKDQLQKAAQSPMLCEVTPEPRQDRIGIYTSPQPAQQEPVAWMCSDESLANKGYSRFSRTCEGAWNIPVYTSPQPSKPWVGLTDEEELKLAQDSVGKSRHWLVAQVEAKLKEKNT